MEKYLAIKGEGGGGGRNIKLKTRKELVLLCPYDCKWTGSKPFLIASGCQLFWVFFSRHDTLFWFIFVHWVAVLRINLRYCHWFYHVGWVLCAVVAKVAGRAGLRVGTVVKVPATKTTLIPGQPSFIYPFKRFKIYNR